MHWTRKRTTVSMLPWGKTVSVCVDVLKRFLGGVTVVLEIEYNRCHSPNDGNTWANRMPGLDTFSMEEGTSGTAQATALANDIFPEITFGSTAKSQTR